MAAKKLQEKLLIFICACAVAQSAPRRTSSTTFDQKQTGEYNIQLHLKDFQIIAVVGDDSFGSLGDYDYNYDYSDFTVKPSTTKKPSTTEASPTSTNPPPNRTELSSSEIPSNPTTATTKKPVSVSHPYPIVSPSTTTTTTQKPIITPSSTPSIAPSEIPTTTKSETVNESKPLPPSTNANENSSSRPEKLPLSLVTSEITEHSDKEQVSTSPAAPSPSSTIKIITTTASIPITTTSNPITTSTTIKSPIKSTITNRPVQTLKPQPPSIPGQIPVVVQDFSIVRNETPIVKDKHPLEPQKDKRGEAVTSVTIVPLEDSNSGELSANDPPALGEILHYRRCAQGYQRDKRGRCRKVRRPQIPLGLTRFASNFATRFRQAGSEELSNHEETA